jgi:hypothetical protein
MVILAEAAAARWSRPVMPGLRVVQARRSGVRMGAGWMAPMGECHQLPQPRPGRLHPRPIRAPGRVQAVARQAAWPGRWNGLPCAAITHALACRRVR